MTTAPNIRTVKLTLAYEGTAYVGWQRQTNGPSIQAALESAVRDVEGGPVTLVGAGRTDAGVHALGQVASVRLTNPIPTDALGRALNATLPRDIRVVAAEEAPAAFHARFDAATKEYRYRLLHGTVASPFESRYGWFVGGPLDHDRMAEAARALVGEHDFAAFQAAGSDTATTVRIVHALTVRRSPPEATPGGVSWGQPLSLVDIRGSGFLRHMVRIIVGTLVEVGRGRRPPGAVGEALRSRDRAAAGPTAPGHGLFLVRVEYPSGA